MKKKVYSFLSILVFLSFSGCFNNIAVPEKIYLKTSDKAEFKFTIAEKEFKMDDYFSLSSFLKSTDDSGQSSDGNLEAKKFNIYDYNPNNSSDIQKFLLKVDVQEIPLDFGSYLEDTEITTSLSGMSVSKEIDIPEISIDERKKIDLDVNKKINNLVTITGTATPYSEVSFSFENTDNGFNKIIYQSGFMNIQSIDDSRKLTGDIVLKYNGFEISRATFGDNGIALLPLDNVTIDVHGLVFEFEDACTGTLFIARVNEDSIVKRAEGISLADPIPATVNTSFDVGNSSSLSSCEIGEGSLQVIFIPPTNWENVDVTYDIHITGGIQAELSETIITTDLSGHQFENQPIKADVDVLVTLENSTLNFITDDGTMVNPDIQIKVDITKIASATVKLDSSYNSTIDQTQDLPKELIESVKEIKWTESGIEIEYVNTLPAGNEINMSLNSDFFDVHQTVPLTTTSEPKTIDDFVNKDDNHVTSFGTQAGQFSKVDVLAEISFPGFNEEEKSITVKNVVPGEHYDISLNITPKLEWNNLVLDASETNQEGTINTKIQMSSLFESLTESIGEDISKKIQLKKLPLYLFCSVPNISETFNDPKFVGTIKAYIGDEKCNPCADINPIYLLGSSSKNGSLSSKAVPVLTKDENNVVISNFETELQSLGINPVNIVDLINPQYDGSGNLIDIDGNLCVSYDVSFQAGDTAGEIELSKDAIKNLNGSTSISLTAFVLLDCDFEVNGDINMPLMNLINKDDDNEENPTKDLLGREEKPDNTNDDYLDLIESVSIKYETFKLPFNCIPNDRNDSLRLEIDLDGKENPACETHKLDLRGDTLKVSPREILAYPLVPTLDLVIPKGTLQIPREMSLKTKLYLFIKTNGNQVQISGKDKGGEQ